MSAFFITGTDTGVGKTFITYNLALGLKNEGIKVGCFKPIETGANPLPEDGNLLAEATGQPVNEIVPVRYNLPLAPRAAELEERKEVSIKLIKEKYNTLRERYEVLLVEGAGGLAVPIKEGYTYADLARELEMPVIIVARAGLGTLNHTYLTWFYATQKGLNIRGIVLNGFEGSDVSERTNPYIVEEMTGIKPVCIRKSSSKRVRDGELEKLLELIGL